MTKELIHSRFSKALENHNREEAVAIITDALENNQISIQTLYEEVLTQSLNSISSNRQEQSIPIWEEHLSSNIVRTVVELTLPYVYQQREQLEANHTQPLNRKKAVVFCLEEEYHELGARMTTDFLTLLGFDAYFIGANTPKQEIFNAIKHFKPDLVCVSVTNYFHLTKLHRLIEELRTIEVLKHFTFIVGGYAVHNSSDVKSQIKADYYVRTFDDLKAVKEAIR